MSETADILHIITQPPVLALGGGAIVSLVAIVAAFWSQVRRAEMDATLKLEMVKRGMSSEEILQILRASRRD